MEPLNHHASSNGLNLMLAKLDLFAKCDRQLIWRTF